MILTLRGMGQIYQHIPKNYPTMLKEGSDVPPLGRITRNPWIGDRDRTTAIGNDMWASLPLDRRRWTRRSSLRQEGLSLPIPLTTGLAVHHYCKITAPFSSTLS